MSNFKAKSDINLMTININLTNTLWVGDILRLQRNINKAEFRQNNHKAN